MTKQEAKEKLWELIDANHHLLKGYVMDVKIVSLLIYNKRLGDFDTINFSKVLQEKGIDMSDYLLALNTLECECEKG